MKIWATACFVVLAALLAAADAQAHTAGLTFSGTGTATVDGVIAGPEWQGSATFAFRANLPGGGTAPGIVRVMNDTSNLYLAVQIGIESSLSAVSFQFDNDHDASWYEEGDDGVALGYGVLFGFNDWVVVKNGRGGCPTGATCAMSDTEVGGTRDGAASRTVANGVTQFEISKPLDSSDDANDFSVQPGAVLGINLRVSIFASPGSPNTTTDPIADGDISIVPSTQPEVSFSTLRGPGINGPWSIAAGADGALWFTNYYGNSISRVTVSGSVTTYADPSISSPSRITLGPDGALWFTNYLNNTIGRITTAGDVSHFSDPRISYPLGITTGPDDALWFANGDSIGRLSTDGSLTTYSAYATHGVMGITAGPDGALWFTNYWDSSIGRITTDGAITIYRDAGIIRPTTIAAGPDGALWFNNDGYSNLVQRITTTGAVSTFADPTLSNINIPRAFVTGPDGALWFTNVGNDSIGRMTTGGVMKSYRAAGIGGSFGIVVGPDRALWFTNAYNNSIGRVAIRLPDTTPPTFDPLPSISVDATGPAGAVASYTVTASDDSGTSPVVACVPVSGSLFAIGKTTVRCTATDGSGNEARTSFVVTVRGAPEQLVDLGAAVVGLGPGASLATKISDARSELAAGDVEKACSTLAAFVNELEAQAGRKVPKATAGQLIAAARRIQTVLGP